MRIYPAIRAQMGDWNYYIVRMKMREVAQDIQLAHDIYEDNTLSDAVQRALGETRVKRDIVGYLARRRDRFFSSIVVAAMEGEPTWHPVEMDTKVVPAIFTNSTSLRESFGVLSFGDEPQYYALDGQHRVAAIKLLVTGEADVNPPSGFDDDLLSVIIVLREEHDVPEGEWMRRYRRLFSSLNRYAKATDTDTNIIMDEDDLFAILTRRLITDHEFFRAPGREKDSFKVQTKGKNLRKDVPHFTTLQTLYAVNEILLKTRERELRGWFPDVHAIDKQLRPNEEFIDQLYEELAGYWNAILETLPDLHQQPVNMRQHDIGDSDGEFQDHLVFWTIGQELFAKLVRNLLDDKFPESGYAAIEQMKTALSPLAQISWELHGSPWRHLLLVKTSPDSPWRMRNEDRKRAIEVARRVLRWILNVDPLNEEEMAELRKEWEDLLYFEPREEKEIDEMWEKVVNTRARVVTGDRSVGDDSN